MKFGGTSVADARCILGVCEIVGEHLHRKPVVVVSALAGVTDLLERAVAAARRGDRETLEPSLADLERRHRWAVAGTVENGEARHQLNLTVDALFEDLRQLLRSIRILGELTPRAADALLSFGETLSARILAAVFVERGLPARWVDPREVVITDAQHGAAAPDLEVVGERCKRLVAPLLEAGEVPVLGGFVGATPAGDTTTLGRGGSDTSAAVLGSAMWAEEIQIWTDVDGLMSADPKLVPTARTLRHVSFAEAAELAFFGARVLHPAAISPAVERQIPVRVLNSRQPGGQGTFILGEPVEDAPPLAAVASRGGLRSVRVTGGKMRMDPGFLPQVLQAFDRAGLVPDLVVSSEVAVTLVVPGDGELQPVARTLRGKARFDQAEGCAILCVVGAGLANDAGVRGRVLAALSVLGPEIVALGGSASSVAAVVEESRLESAVRKIHQQFFEEADRS